jgi:hypothetical protein
VGSGDVDVSLLKFLFEALRYFCANQSFQAALRNLVALPRSFHSNVNLRETSKTTSNIKTNRKHGRGY